MPIEAFRAIPRTLRWTRASCFLIGALFAPAILVIILWWPLVVTNFASFDPALSWWKQLDWLLIGNFLAMSLLAMAGANARADALIIFVSGFGGFVIESWGTQTQLWTYFTLERPPLWILPAWPLATLTIDRLTRGLNHFIPHKVRFNLLYWPVFVLFYGLMLAFVRPFAGTPSTLMALVLGALIILTPTDHRIAVLTFIAGSGLGYFLERWGTTRECWTYYTQQTPPLFAVLAHGMAAVAFWRVGRLLKAYAPAWVGRGLLRQPIRASNPAGSFGCFRPSKPAARLTPSHSIRSQRMNPSTTSFVPSP
jgi:hypothetical protein